MDVPKLENTVIGIKGAGDLATGVAVRLYKHGFSKIFMMEVAQPLAVRRKVALSEAVYEREVTVEGVRAINFSSSLQLESVWAQGAIGVIVDPGWSVLPDLRPDVLVDAIIAKKNLGTRIDDASLVIGLGPGFTAGIDVHRAIETMRGPDLGKVLTEGSPLENTGIPAPVDGYATERVLRAPDNGVFRSLCSIGDLVEAGDTIGTINEHQVVTQLSGVVRGMIRPGIKVNKGCKIGDVDPRADIESCFKVSDKACAIGGGVLKAILSELYEV